MARDSVWYLGLSEGAADETKARYAFLYGDSGVSIRMGLIACHYRAAQCGATKRSSSLPTSSCSTWTKAAPDRVCETSFRRASAAAADGKHARVDGFASLSVLASAALVAAGLNRADPVIGLVITLVFLRIAWSPDRSASRPARR